MILTKYREIYIMYIYYTILLQRRKVMNTEKENEQKHNVELYFEGLPAILVLAAIIVPWIIGAIDIFGMFIKAVVR